ncbi:SURF1 family protein [Falsiroseomonas sp.]|jgi:surfeit locus 1 family protein|uniref:SURF1 family protein n=1 Tax=Falsiroseomonas sp. TaxID=2870721 RepID=UPI003F71FBC7
MQARRILLPLLVMLPVLAVLLGLGTWQVQRLGAKNALLAEIAAGEAAPARPLGAAAPPSWTKVAATGRFDHEREVLLGLEVRGPILGARLVTPLLRDGAPPVLVDRGWVPMDKSGTIARPAGPVTIEAYARPGETAGMLSATDDPAGRRFYTFDPPLIARSLGLPAPEPFGLVALGGPGGALPDPARTLPRPTNSHLGYAVTWYGLALSLLGVFAVWLRRRLKEPA